MDPERFRREELMNPVRHPVKEKVPGRTWSAPVPFHLNKHECFGCLRWERILLLTSPCVWGMGFLIFSPPCRGNQSSGKGGTGPRAWGEDIWATQFWGGMGFREPERLPCWSGMVSEQRPQGVLLGREKELREKVLGEMLRF